jgi:plasmid stability protein
MASITIRKLEEAVKLELRVQAALNGHSMEEEARAILTAGVKKKSHARESVYKSIRRHMAEAGLKGVDLPTYTREPIREPIDFSEPEYGR